MVALDRPKARYLLHQRQYDAMRIIFEEGVDQLLYGGAAGGGKSHLLRALAYTLAELWPGAKIPIFRLTTGELEETHIDPWRNEMSSFGYDDAKAWGESKKNYTFPWGSVVEFRHIDQRLGARKWLSAEWAALLLDEGTTFTAKDIQLLYSRVRRSQDDERAQQWKGWRPLMVVASNPGGPGHAYFKEEFIDEAEKRGGSGAVWDAEITLPTGEVTVVRRAFLRSMLDDNPSIRRSEYIGGLAQLPEEERKRMLEGDWTYFEGQVFSVDPLVHYIDAHWAFGGDRYPPRHWPRIASYDHGNSNPASCEWITRDEDGFFIAYLEYYGPGPNTTHIDAIWSRMQEDGVLQPQLKIIGDPQMVRKDRSVGSTRYSVAEEFLWGGLDDDGFRENQGIQLIFPHLERRPGRETLQRLLQPNPNRVFPHWHPLAGQYGAPQLFIAQQCPNLYTELQNIRYKEGDPDEDTVKVDDHAYDALWRSMLVFERMLSSRRGGRLQPVARLEAR